MKLKYLIFSLILLTACSTTAPQRTQLMSEFSPEEVTAFDIRVRLNNFAPLYGKDLFGSSQYMAINTAETLELQIKEYIFEFKKDSLDIESKENRIKAFTQINPIKDLSFYRRSILPQLVDILSKKDLGLAKSLGTIEQGLDDLRTGL
jgi:hypothetical protein